MWRRALICLALVTQLSGCGEDAVCGADDGAQDFAISTVGSEQVRWEDWRSSPNNDCGEAGGPTSLTLEASQVGTNRGLTLCLPRPDKLSASAEDVLDESRVRIIDIFADVAGAGDCLASINRAMPATGSIAFPGVCDDGLHPDGYSLDMDFAVPVTVTCATEVREEVMRFSGVVRVQATQL